MSYTVGFKLEKCPMMLGFSLANVIYGWVLVGQMFYKVRFWLVKCPVRFSFDWAKVV